MSDKWYVGVMNDAIFIADEPPSPAPLDYVREGEDANIIAAMGAATVETTQLAEKIVAAHNASLERR